MSGMPKRVRRSTSRACHRCSPRSRICSRSKVAPWRSHVGVARRRCGWHCEGWTFSVSMSLRSRSTWLESWRCAVVWPIDAGSKCGTSTTVCLPGHRSIWSSVTCTENHGSIERLIERLAPGGLLAVASLSEVGAETRSIPRPAGRVARTPSPTSRLLAEGEGDGVAFLVGRKPG